MFLLGVHRGQWDDSPATNLELREIRLPDETKTFNSVLMSQRRNMGNHFKEQMGLGQQDLTGPRRIRLMHLKEKKCILEKGTSIHLSARQQHSINIC